MKSTLALGLLFSAFLSGQALASGENCRLSIGGYFSIIGDNAPLEASARSILSKKGIDLIHSDEARDGDYVVKGLIAETYFALPMHSYKFEYTNNIVRVPCNGFPLCSPLINARKVKAITGIDYQDNYDIHFLKGSKSSLVGKENFKHKYRGKVIPLRNQDNFSGSLEQDDLIRAIAAKMPKCSKLKKLIKN